MKPELLVTMSMPEGYAELLERDFTVHYLPKVRADDPRIADVATGVRAVLTNGTVGIDAALQEFITRKKAGMADAWY